MRSRLVLHAVDSHTEGMPTRVITGGVGVIPGATMSDRRTYFMEHLDHLRTLLMFEPRGHASMSGAILQPPTRPDADYGVLFIEVSGCLPMCGHGTIGVATVLVETGMVPVVEPVTTVRLDTPAGLVTAEVHVQDGAATRRHARATCPSYCVVLDRKITLPGGRSVTYDLAYGGNFYAILPLEQFDLPFDRARKNEILAAGPELMAAINAEDEPYTRWTRRARLPSRPVPGAPTPTPDTRGTRWPSTRAGSTARPAARERARGWRSCMRAAGWRSGGSSSTSPSSERASPGG